MHSKNFKFLSQKTKAFCLVVALLSLSGASTEFQCDRTNCFFSAKDCRSETSGAPASIHSSAENAIAAKMANAYGGKLGLGGFYFEDDGLGWEDSSSGAYTPVNFNPARSGFLVVDGTGSWSVVSFADRGSYRFLCKIAAADTTTTAVTTTTLATTTLPTTTSTTTHTTTFPITVINSTTVTTNPATTNATTVPQVTNTTTAPQITNVTTAPQMNTTMPVTNATTAFTNATTQTTYSTAILTNETSVETNASSTSVTDVLNTTTESETTLSNETETISNATAETNFSTSSHSTTVVPPTTAIPTTPSPTAVNGTHPIGAAFDKWSQRLIAFTSPLPLAVRFVAPFSDGSSSYDNLLAVMDSTDATCTSPSRAYSPINFANRDVGIFTFAAPPQIMNVFEETTYYICVSDSTTGATWSVGNASITVVPFHTDFISTGFRTISTGANNSLVELAIPSVATAPFVIKLEVYDSYSFAFGKCNSQTRLKQTPIVADSRLYLVRPATGTAPEDVLSVVCVSAPEKSLLLEIHASPSSFLASSRVSKVAAGQYVAISLGGSVPPPLQSGMPVAWVSREANCSRVSGETLSMTGIATKGYVFALEIPSTAPYGSFICVSAFSNDLSSMTHALVEGPDGPLHVGASISATTPLVIQQGILTPIELSSFISYGDATSDFSEYIAALGAIATEGTRVWLAVGGREQCANATAPMIGSTKLLANSAVQWNAPSWERMPVGSYSLCYYGANQTGKWIRINVVIVNHLTGTMSANQKVLLGTNIFTSLVTTGVADNSIAWSLALANKPSDCTDATALVASGTFYQQGHYMFGTFGLSAAVAGPYILCGSTFGPLQPISKVDAVPQVEGPSDSIVSTNYIPQTWAVGDITQYCGVTSVAMPQGIVFPLNDVMWSAVARFVSQTGFGFTSKITASDFDGTNIAIPFFIPCPTCPAIAFPSLVTNYKGCASAESLIWSDVLQYLTVASKNQPTGSIRAAPHRSGVHVRLIASDDITLDPNTINKAMVCMNNGSAAEGFVTSSQTLRFVASSDLSSGRMYIACSHSMGGAWLYSGLVSTLTGGGDGGSVGTAQITRISGLPAVVRIPAAQNLTLDVEGTFPDMKAGAYSLSFAYGGVECSRSNAGFLVANVVLAVKNASSATATLDLAQTALLNGTASVCFHTGTVKIEKVPPSSTESLTGNVTFLFPTLRTLNFLSSVTVPSGFSQTYKLIVTDTDYTPAQISLVESNADGSVTCGSYGPRVAAVMVVDRMTKTALLTPFVNSVNSGNASRSFRACISGRVADSVRWFPSDFTLNIAPEGKGGVTTDTYALRVTFTNPIDAVGSQFRNFATNRLLVLDGKPERNVNSVLIGQLNATGSVIVSVPSKDGVPSSNSRAKEWYAALATGGGNLAFPSTISGRLAVVESVSLTFFDGSLVPGFGTVKAGIDAVTDAPIPETDTTDYGTRAFLIFVCIAIPVILGVVGHAFVNKVTGNNVPSSPPAKRDTEVELSVIVSRDEPSQAATEMTPNRTRDDAIDVSSPVPEHPLRSAIGRSS